MLLPHPPVAVMAQHTPRPPGYTDPATGSWLSTAIDLSDDGLLVMRNHTAGRRVDPVRANEKVLGPGWQLQPLGGILGNRLADHSVNGHVDLDVGADSRRYLIDPQRPATFVSVAGRIVKNADGTFTQTDTGGLVVTWNRVNGRFLPTSVALVDGDLQTVTYDDRGRVSRLASPATTKADCHTLDPKMCSTATFRYADTTTATPSTLGTAAGQLTSIRYDAAGDTGPATTATYRYDAAGRLRQVRVPRRATGEPARRFRYTYTRGGDISDLATTQDGAWRFTYSAPGSLATSTTISRQRAAGCPAPYASDYILRGSCPVEVDIKQGRGKALRKPFWQKTLTGGPVMGITNDGCSAPIIGNKPASWLDFRVACDSHDYGYGLIRNTMNGESYGLARSQRTHVDAVFFTIMKERVCAGFTGTITDPFHGTQSSKRSLCMGFANAFYKVVRAKGDRYL
jgi:hypothetical protein